jgi:hypothetical protein
MNKIEKEKVILIIDDDRNTYKEKYKIDFSEEKFLHYFEIYI